jgi:pimeloyl-ACP methyl ester carboxylesterase
MSRRSEPFECDGVGVRLAGERWLPDEGRGAVVVFLHGIGQTRHSWRRTAERLAAGGRTAIALDLRGHGDSGWHAEQDYSLNGLVEDLTAFLQTVDDPPVVVGASLGGITGLVTAGERPGLVGGLVLVDVVVQLEPAGVQRIRDFLSARPEGFDSLDEVAAAIAAYNPQRRRPRNLNGLRKNVRLGPDGRWRWHWDPAFMSVDGQVRRRTDPARLRAAAARVTVPTLIVRGVQSDVVSDAGLADMLRQIPGAEAADVATAGHMVAGDDNDVFATALDGFLARRCASTVVARSRPARDDQSTL